jgi:hypothetical protein
MIITLAANKKSLNKTLVLTADYSSEISVLEQEEKPFLYIKKQIKAQEHMSQKNITIRTPLIC